jgi:hypothetical protein
VSNELAKIQEEQNVLSISEFNAIIHPKFKISLRHLFMND